MSKHSAVNLLIFKTFGVILAYSILQEDPYFDYLAVWVVQILLNKDISGNVLQSHIPVTGVTENLINFVKFLNECDTEKSINDSFDAADGLAFEQIINLEIGIPMNQLRQEIKL